MSCMSFRQHSHAAGPASGPSVLVANAAALTRPACPAAGDVASFRAGWLFPEPEGHAWPDLGIEQWTSRPLGEPWGVWRLQL